MTKRSRKISNSKLSSRASEALRGSTLKSSTGSIVSNRASQVLKSSASKSLAGSVLSQTTKFSRTASFCTKSIAERILTRHDKAFSELSKK